MGEYQNNDHFLGACDLPKRRMWTEVVMDFWAAKFPVQRGGPIWWFVKRFCLLFVIWFFGLLASAYDGVLTGYLLNLQFHVMFFVTGMVVLYATGGLRSFLEWLPEWASPILRLDESEFKQFLEKGERWATSFLPPSLWTVAMMLLYLSSSQETIVQSLTARSVVEFGLGLFSYLLQGTGIWIIISIWLVVFRVSRQPLDLQLSPQTSKTFRPLAMPSLYGAASFFLIIFLIPFFQPLTSILELTVFGLFILFGALAFLVPFYNIHLVLVRLKKDELLSISEETSKLIRELNETLLEQPARDSGDRIRTIAARLLALHIREKRVEEAQEWPVDISFFSALGGLILMASGRLIMTLVERIFLS